MSEKKGTQIRRKEDVELATDEIINLALYDQADPGNLFLCTIDDSKFEKLKNKQNLNIEQFSLFSSHLQSLFNHCIQNLPNELTHTNGCHMRYTDCDRKFICALKTMEKTSTRMDETIPGVQVQIF